MKLRYRLFFWVGLLFCIAFVVSFYFEDRVTKSNLQKTYNELVKKLDELNENRIKAIESYLSDLLFQIQAEMDAVLQGVDQYQLVRKGFEPSLNNLENANWLDSASLMITNKWVDYIQSLNENALMSEIMVDRQTLNDTLHIPVENRFHFVAIRSSTNSQEWQGPFIGINLSISPLSEIEEKSQSDYYAYFTPEVILNFQTQDGAQKNLNLSINLLDPFLKWLELPAEKFYLNDFLASIFAAQAYLKEHSEKLPTQAVWQGMIEEQQKNRGETVNTTNGAQSAQQSADELYEQRLNLYEKNYIEHYNKIGLIWGLAALTHSSLFGNSPFSAEAPIGIGIVDGKSSTGKGLLSRSVFYDKPQYQVAAPFQNRGAQAADFLTKQLEIIAPAGTNQFFFGTTLSLGYQDGAEKRVGYLTIGTGGAGILDTLARSTHQMTMFISGNRIVDISNADGVHIDDPAWYALPVNELISNSSGIVNAQGEEYFFLHLTPYKQIDLHFIILNSKDKEFAFIDSMKAGAAETVKNISFEMRLASIGGLIFVLIFLNNISKRITRPITHLAEVTEHVADGNLDAIQIPAKTKPKSSDEVSALYHSFFEMVKGLREKEKVRGVLNKVVSKEIAEEALKGNIQLGGEEKRVTVLFADIRSFTSITEHMEPQEVIKLVNSCMTKVSQKIDKFGGVIDKYVGDEVMALFGAPLEKKESALSAIKSAIETIEELKHWNTERRKQGLREIEMGIGIHTGNVVAGNMGAENRLNYTVLGANVNMAARICSGAKGMQILISESTLEAEGVKDYIEYEKLQSVELKGFTKPVVIYAVKSFRNIP